MGGGGKGGSSTNASNPAADTLARISEDLFNQTDPLRQQLLGQSEDFVSGGSDVTQLPSFGASKDILESQFGRAQESIIANTPEGGGLTSALAGLEGDRASGLASIQAQAGEAERNRAAGLATGGAVQGQTGLGQAGGIQSQLALAQAQENAGKAGGIGQLGQASGTVLASK